MNHSRSPCSTNGQSLSRTRGRRLRTRAAMCAGNSYPEMKRSCLRGARRISAICTRVSLRPFPLPAGIVLLHHPETGGELDAAEGALEAAEAVAVAGADQ